MSEEGREQENQEVADTVPYARFRAETDRWRRRAEDNENMVKEFKEKMARLEADRASDTWKWTAASNQGEGVAADPIDVRLRALEAENIKLRSSIQLELTEAKAKAEQSLREHEIAKQQAEIDRELTHLEEKYPKMDRMMTLSTAQAMSPDDGPSFDDLEAAARIVHNKMVNLEKSFYEKKKKSAAAMPGAIPASQSSPSPPPPQKFKTVEEATTAYLEWARQADGAE